MSWQISNAQWLRWIESDGVASRTSWISCDEFDEALRQRLEAQPFLGTAENTVMQRVDAEQTRATAPPTPSGDAFDSMATVVRMAPEGFQTGAPEPEAAQTLVKGKVATREPASPGGLSVTVKGGGYEVELEPAGAAAPVRSGSTLKTKPVQAEIANDGALDDIPPVASNDEGLYIPVLSREAADAALDDADIDLDDEEPQEIEPEEAEPEEIETELEPEEIEPVPEPEPPAVVEPQSASSSGTMVVQPLHRDDMAPVPAQTGHTVIIQTDLVQEPPAPAERTVIAPEPVGPFPGAALPPVRATASAVPTPAPEDSETAGEIVTTIDPAAESQTAGEVPDDVRASRSGKIVVGGVPGPVSSADSDEIDATDIVEEAEELPPVPPPESERSGLRAVPPPPAPPTRDPVDLEPMPEVAESSDSRRKVPGWYDEVFGDHFVALRRRNRGRTAKAEVEFFLQGSALEPGARILDVGCGDGAHAITLGQRGFRVVGIDSSRAQVSLASQAASRLGVAVEFMLADMRDVTFDGQFDGILCLGTTFGYFEDDVNRRVLRRLRERLAPTGRMLLQVFNRDYVASRLPSRSWWQGHGCLVLDEAAMNYFKDRLHVHRTIVFEDGRQFEHDIFVRAHSAHELGRMCVEAGLRVMEISGCRFTRGRFFGATSPEIWLLVQPK